MPDEDARAAFIRAHTAVAAPPLVPEVRLHLALEVTPLWEASEALLERAGLPPPYWAFAWPGSQALARLVLDRPDLVRGRRVLDFAAGSGLAGIAALAAGAAAVEAVDIDPFAATAQRLNAQLNGARLNGARLDVRIADPTRLPPPACDIVLAGDVCYEQPTAGRALGWLRQLAGTGILVLLADPGRAYAPRDGLEPVAAYSVPTTRELEDREVRQTPVWRLAPDQPPAA
jgi:predicted nicotinamide N-methyase